MSVVLGRGAQDRRGGAPGSRASPRMAPPGDDAAGLFRFFARRRGVRCDHGGLHAHNHWRRMRTCMVAFFLLMVRQYGMWSLRLRHPAGRPHDHLPLIAGAWRLISAAPRKAAIVVCENQRASYKPPTL